MSLKNLTKLFLLILACCLMFYGYGYYKNTIPWHDWRERLKWEDTRMP